MDETDTFEALKNPKGTRAQILNAAMICIMTIGPARTNISSIAAQAGVSRPTVYAHFEDLEDIIKEAITTGIGHLTQYLETQTAGYDTPQERITQTYLRLLELSKQIDILSKPMSYEISPGQSDRNYIPEEAIFAARNVLDKLIGDGLLESDPARANERAETGVRFFLSLAAFRHADDLRGYITRAVLPALGF